jgi:uncharacterized protein (TIGR03435 family)
MKRALAGLSFLVLFSIAGFGQSPAALVAFDVADIHKSAPSQFPFFQDGVLRGDRYVLRDATLVDLIATAYGVGNEKVVGGPSWLDTDRFDVIAKAPPTTTPETIKLMLQSMLADRFKLVLHTDTKPLSVFVLSVGKGKPKLKEAAGGEGNTGCIPQQQQQNATPDGPPPYNMVSCHNETMERFAQDIHNMAGGYLTSAVVDSTGLKGAWDFDIKWTGRGALARAGADGISIFDAVDKQLGLKLDAQKIPLPVYVVDSANEKPTDNPASVATTLPPKAPAEFEVAIIKPSAPGETPNGAINGSQINLQFTTLRQLITIAWDLNPANNDMIVNAPKWLDSDHFDITAKVTTDAPPPGRGAPNQLPADIDDLRHMLRALLEERFQLKTHMEDRPINAYSLIAVNPKLKKADPTNRTGCKEGPGADGKDPRISNPELARLVTCLNMTMPQFAEQLRLQASGYLFQFPPIEDATGLEGAYDFTISFSVAGGGRGGDAAPSGGGAGLPSDPTGGLSLFDALNKQLGLKLEMRKRPIPVLVIDHVEEKPTDN